jgi:enolase-phosphatase E1
VYDDVPRALARWTEAGKTVAVFSSGSVRAQRMLFAHTQAGDLTPHLSEYFDTTIGFKSEPESYRRIATRLDRLPAAILFVSDVAAELDAARAAGMQTALAARSDTMPMGATHRLVRTFDRLG